MFVKIKLEEQCNSKAPLIFNIEDSATVYNLKTKLESCVDIPREEQEIRTMDRILNNQDELSEIVNQQIDGRKLNGAAISLYTMNGFHCFLQFYNQNEGENQSNFFNQPPNARNLPIDKIPQYCEIDSDDSSTYSTSSSETDSTTDQSGTSSDYSHSPVGSKRKSLEKKKSPPKRACPVVEATEEVCATVTPKSQENNIQEVSEQEIVSQTAAATHPPRVLQVEPIASRQTTVSSKAAVILPSAVMEVESIAARQPIKSIGAPVILPPAVQEVEHIAHSIVSTGVSVMPPPAVLEVEPIAATKATASKRSSPAVLEVEPIAVIDPLPRESVISSAPYIALRPEQRRYALVIGKYFKKHQPDYGHLMEHFYGLFETSQSCAHLNFSESTSITAYDDQLWVLCEDNETCDWIAQGVRSLNSYKCSTFVEYLGLLRCRVVVPHVEGKEYSKIFQLLELQNSGLSTDKWCVMERYMLDEESDEYTPKAVTNLCKNELITVCVDLESKRLIQENSFKLKYCFWKLTFEF